MFTVFYVFYVFLSYGKNTKIKKRLAILHKTGKTWHFTVILFNAGLPNHKVVPKNKKVINLYSYNFYLNQMRW